MLKLSGSCNLLFAHPKHSQVTLHAIAPSQASSSCFLAQGCLLWAAGSAQHQRDIHDPPAVVVAFQCRHHCLELLQQASTTGMNSEPHVSTGAIPYIDQSSDHLNVRSNCCSCTHPQDRLKCQQQLPATALCWHRAAESQQLLCTPICAGCSCTITHSEACPHTLPTSFSQSNMIVSQLSYGRCPYPSFSY